MKRAIAAATAVLALFATTGCVDELQIWKDDCAAQGGHVMDSTKTTTGVGANPTGKGGPVITVGTTTTYFCISEDGKVLSIR